MPDATYTVNTWLPPRRWSRMVAITLSDTNTDKNLQVNGRPYRYLHNTGTSGEVIITWEPDNATGTATALWIPQGGFVEGGLWANARATGATAGLELLGCIGTEEVGS